MQSVPQQRVRLGDVLSKPFQVQPIPSSSRVHHHQQQPFSSTTNYKAAGTKTRAQQEESLIEVKFAIRKKIFPLPDHDSYRSPQEYYGCEGFLIAVIQVNVNGRLLEYRIQGELPHHAPYYLYECQCLQRQHPKYGPYYLIHSVLKCHQSPLNEITLQWVLTHELHYSAREVERTLLQVPSFPKAPLPKPLAEIIASQSLYGCGRKTSSLERWFPKDTAVAVTSALAALTPSRRLEFEEILSQEPWMFAFDAHCKAFGLPDGAVISLDQLRRHCPEAIHLPLEDALACYRYLVDWTARNGHTTFYAHNLRPELRGATLSFLVERAKLVYRECIQTRDCYWLMFHREAEDKILDALRRTWENFYRTLGPPRPLNQSQRRPPKVVGTDSQVKAVGAVSLNPFVLVRGAPGTGKTSTIEQILDQYGEEQTALCTLTGSMVAGHHERDLLSSSTLHRPLTDLEVWTRNIQRLEDTIAHMRTLLTSAPPEYQPKQQQQKKNMITKKQESIAKSKTPATLADRIKKKETRLHQLQRRLEGLQKRLADTRILIIDEFSNIELQLFARILAIYPNVCCLVFVFDEWQIPPVSDGQPCLDLLAALGESYGIELQANQRVSGAATERLLLNDRLVVSGRAHEMTFDAILKAGSKQGPASALDQTGGCILIEPSGQGLEKDLSWITTNFLPNSQTRQVLTLTNKERIHVNSILQKASSSSSPSPTTFSPIQTRSEIICANQRLTVHRNFPRVVVRIDGRNNTLLPPDRLSATATAKGRTVGEEEVEDDSDDGSSGGKKGKIRLISHAVSNGEVFLFAYAQDYNLRKRTWCSQKIPMLDAMHVVSGLTVPTDHIRFLVTKDGRRFCLHDGYVPRSAILPAWALSVNKSQGREFEGVILVLPTDPGPFGRHHLHVALSRGKRCLIVYGTMEQLLALANNAEKPRYTLLAWRVKCALKAWLLAEESHMQQQQEQKHVRRRGGM